MKKIFLLGLAAAIGLSAWAQQRTGIPASLKNVGIKKESPSISQRHVIQFENPALKSVLAPFETPVGDSYYDWQTNATMQNRLYYHDDGTFSATWMNGYAYPGFADRGTAYVYYDGNEWGDYPTDRIESQRSGWGNYWPLGENGEIVISHISGGTDDGLLINRRPQKGAGTWSEVLFPGPAASPGIIWPSAVVTGVDNSIIHLLAVTRPVANGGVLYQGVDGALLYSRSVDGGDTWEPQNVFLDEVSPGEYLQFEGDIYDFAVPRNGVIAFVVGGPFTEGFLMKSTDNGDTWQKTLIWEHPYPLWHGAVTDTFYCIDGSWDVKLDNNGMVHAVFGINRAHSDGSGTFWFPFIDGVGYWNETMPAFSDNLDALCPFSDCEYTELVENYNLIAWTQDVDGDGEITFVGTSIDNIGRYYVGLSSMVQLVMGESNQLYVIYSSVTETFSNQLQNYRHLWTRVSPDGGLSWGPFTDLTNSLAHLFDECVWPVAAHNSDPNTLYLIYQVDGEPGMALSGDEDPYGQNYWNFMEVQKDEITGLHRPAPAIQRLQVSQNTPNPFSGQSTIGFEVTVPGDVLLEIVNITGQKVYEEILVNAAPGTHAFALQGDLFSKGVYFYTVSTGGAKVTRKMVVE